MLIAICGMDGSGKTTLAKKYAKDFKGTIYHGHRYSMSANSFGFNGRGGYFLIPLVIIAYLDCLYTYYFKYRPLMKKGTLICDRYFYDKVARLIYYKICPRWLAKVILKILPKPDITEILVNPFVLKGEIIEHNHWRKIYIFVERNIKWIN